MRILLFKSSRLLEEEFDQINNIVVLETFGDIDKDGDGKVYLNNYIGKKIFNNLGNR